MEEQEIKSRAKKVAISIAYIYAVVLCIWITNTVLFSILTVTMLFLAIYCINKNKNRVELFTWCFLFFLLWIGYVYFK